MKEKGLVEKHQTGDNKKSTVFSVLFLRRGLFTLRGIEITIVG